MNSNLRGVLFPLHSRKMLGHSHFLEKKDIWDICFNSQYTLRTFMWTNCLCSNIQNYCVTLCKNMIKILTISRGTLELNLKRSEFPSFWCRGIVFLGATVALLLVFLLHVRRGCCSWWGTPSFLWVLHFRSNRQKLESSDIFCLFIWTAESSYRFYCWDIYLNSNVQFKVIMAVTMKTAVSSVMMSYG